MPRKTGQVKKKISKNLQGFLWSVPVEDLDLKEDKVYIINQILAYGGLEELKWLFKVYPKKTIRKIFINKPLKIYVPSSFNFVKEILLGVEDKNLDPYSYDRNLPRRIRR